MEETQTKSVTPYARRRRLLRWLGVAAFAVVILVLLLPTLLSITGQVARIAEGKLAQDGHQVSIGKCRIGWFTPLLLEQATIEESNGAWRVELPTVAGSMGLFDVLMSKDLGDVVVESPVVTLRSAEVESPPETSPADLRVHVAIRDLSLYVQPSPSDPRVVVGENISVGLTWQAADGKRVLGIDPGRILDELELTPELCHLGLKYVAPVLANVSWTGGQISLELETCHLALDEPSETIVNGKLTLHTVEAGLQPTAAKVVAEVLRAVRDAEMKDSIRLAEQSVVEFDIQDGVVHHSGFEFGLPDLERDIYVHTRGSVYFDQRIEIFASVPIPFDLPGSTVLSKAMKDEMIEFPIRGTLSEPKLEFDMDAMVDKLKSVLVSEDLDINAKDVVDALRGVRERMQQRREDRRPLPPRRLRDRLRPLRRNR